MAVDQPIIYQVTEHRQIACFEVYFCIFISFLFISIFPVSGQAINCATSSPTQHQLNTFQNATQMLSQQRTSGALRYIAIKPLVVRETNGTGGATLEDLNQTLSSLNNTFKGLNVEFYFSSTGIKYINNSDFYNFDSRAEAELTEGNDVTNAINIYFLNSIKINGFEGSGGYAYFPGSESYTNRIFIINDATKDGYMLAHELGHYFGLVHTFERIGGMELVNRGEEGNCADAGDHICDTEADPYGLDGATWEGCDYTGNVTDLNGDFYTPPADNIMSYYNHCAQRFTPGQFERMEIGATIRVTQSEYNLLSSAPAKVVAPSNLTFVNNETSIILQWTDLSENETGFIVERSTSLEGDYVSIAGLGPNITTYTDNEILPGVAYYYRVKPSNTTNSYSNIVLHCPEIKELEDISGETEACLGGYEYSIPFSEGLSYEWTISGGGELTYSDNKATIEWSTPGIYSVSVTTSNACISGLTKSIYVHVNDGSFATASSIEGPDEVCSGDFYYSVQPIEGASFLWNLSSGGTISGEGNSIMVHWDTPGNHILSLIPSNKCGEGEPINLKVKVLENPDAEDIGEIQARSTTVCQGSHEYSVQYFNNVQYEWTIPEGSGSINSDGSTATINWEVPGNYDINLTIKSKCADDISKIIQVKVVETPEKPTISIINGKLTSNLQGEHQWFIDGEPISGAIGPVCPATLAGSYTVQQISACGQGPVSEAFVLDKPLVNNDFEQQIFIFPNPATILVSVEIPSDMEWKNISMVSAMGESLIIFKEGDSHDTTIRGNVYKRLINFEVGHLAPGLYMIKVQMNDGVISKRLLVK